MEDLNIPVEGHPSLVRSKKSGAILNINKTEIEQARMRKKAQLSKDEEFNKLKEMVVENGNELKAIKMLLQQLVEK